MSIGRCPRVVVLLRVAGLSLVLPALAAAGVDSFHRAAPVEAAQFGFEWDQDRDFDGQPDDWARREGTGFPRYIAMEIDREVSADGEHSLRIDVEGGKAAYYSPPVAISPHQSYVFTGKVRTTGLLHDAAIVSLSFLDARRERVQRVLSAPVSGSFDGWSEIRIGPVMPESRVHYVVVGCHLVHDHAQMDYSGTVWFDSLSLRMLPRLTLKTNFAELFKNKDLPLHVDAIVSGLGSDGDYRMRLALEDVGLNERDAIAFPLSATGADLIENSTAEPTTNSWTVKPGGPGFYRLLAVLERDGVNVLEKSTSFVVFDDSRIRRATTRRDGFGWSVDDWPEQANPEHLLAAASAAGIGWIKLPLWSTIHQGDAGGTRSAKVADLLHDLKREGIRTVGVLQEPPREMRRKFADDWNGISEIFTMPPSFWMPSIEPVMARYSSLVHHWQLGSDRDASFMGAPQLSDLFGDLKRQFDRLGRDTMLGAHWKWDRALPGRKGADDPFLLLASNPPVSDSELMGLLSKSASSGYDRWVLLQPRIKLETESSDEALADLDQRIAELLRRVVAARIGNADLIFAADVFDPQHGLLNEDASPSELFLPWRTWTQALDGAEYLGSLRLPNKSVNHVFANESEAIICAWNEDHVEEEIALGKDLMMVSVWGKSEALSVRDRKKVIPVGPVPVLLRGGSAQLARFRLDTRFEKGRLPSSTAESEDHLVITNPFDQGVTGECELRAPREWEIRPSEFQFSLKRGETTRVPIRFRLPSHQSLGPAPVDLEFKVDGETLDYVEMTRDLIVGLDDITIEVTTEQLPGDVIEIRQRIENKTEETLSFRVNLYVPGQKRQRRRISNLQSGESNTISYRVPSARSFVGRQLRIRAEQENGNRVLNKSWIME